MTPLLLKALIWTLVGIGKTIVTLGELYDHLKRR